MCYQIFLCKASLSLSRFLLRHPMWVLVWARNTKASETPGLRLRNFGRNPSQRQLMTRGSCVWDRFHVGLKCILLIKNRLQLRTPRLSRMVWLLGTALGSILPPLWPGMRRLFRRFLYVLWFSDTKRPAAAVKFLLCQKMTGIQQRKSGNKTFTISHPHRQ